MKTTTQTQTSATPSVHTHALRNNGEYPLYALASQLNRPVSNRQMGIAALLATTTVAALFFAVSSVRADDGKEKNVATPGTKVAAAPGTTTVDGNAIDGGVKVTRKPAGKTTRPVKVQEVLPSVEEIEKLIADGKKEEAIVVLQKLRWRTPKDAKASYLLGNLYCEKLWFSDGAKAYQNAFAHDASYRKDPVVLGNLVDSLRNERFFPKATAFFTTELGKDAIPVLEKAAQHKNKLVRERARGILEGIMAQQ